MKKLLILLSFASIFLSCSDDDTGAPQEEPFFNLEVGNKWVYKRYNQNLQNGMYEFRGRIDTIRVTGQQIIDGQNYFILNHTALNTGGVDEQNNEYVRVNENGHLVKSNGLVKHPGKDATYQYTRVESTGGGDFSTVNEGEVFYELLSPQDITLEGSTYSVYPYTGYFTPYETSSAPEGVGHVINYKAGLGLVLERCRYLAQEVYYEDRLVYYELN